MSEYLRYGKCPKISDTKVYDKMIHANNADPDPTALEEARTVCSGSALFAISLSIKKKQLHKKQHLTLKTPR